MIPARFLDIFRVPVYIDARPFILIVAVLSFLSWRPPGEVLKVKPTPHAAPRTATDTVFVSAMPDDLTKYIVSEVRKVEAKFQAPGPMTADDDPFEVAVYEIHRREGYVPRPYRCPAGLLTVGMGDVIDTKAEREFLSGMDFTTARAKVYANLKTGADEVKTRFPGKYTKPNQLFALSLLGHSIGWDRLQRNYPEFYREIQNGTPSVRWLKYCRYRDKRSGRMKTSPNLVRTRRVEWLLFNDQWTALSAYHADAAKTARYRFDTGRRVSMETLGRE